MIILAASKSTDGNGAEAAADRRKGEQLRVIYWLGSNIFHGGSGGRGGKTVIVTKEGLSLETLLNSIDSMWWDGCAEEWGGGVPDSGFKNFVVSSIIN